MKKIIIGLTAFSIISVTSISVYRSQNSVTDTLSLTNIDALSNNESTRCEYDQCKSVTSGTCYYYKLDGSGNISETGERRPFAYDSHNIM